MKKKKKLSDRYSENEKLEINQLIQASLCPFRLNRRTVLKISGPKTTGKMVTMNNGLQSRNG